MDSGGAKSSNCKEGHSKKDDEDGDRTKSPVPPKQNDAKLASDGVSETPDDHRVNHGTSTVMGRRGDTKGINDYEKFLVGGLTLTKEKLLSNEHEGKGSGESTPQRKEKEAGLMGSINDGQRGMEQEMETATVDERESMTSINDSGKFSVGVSATSKRNSLPGIQKENALN